MGTATRRSSRTAAAAAAAAQPQRRATTKSAAAAAAADDDARAAADVDGATLEPQQKRVRAAAAGTATTRAAATTGRRGSGTIRRVSHAPAPPAPAADDDDDDVVDEGADQSAEASGSGGDDDVAGSDGGSNGVAGAGTSVVGADGMTAAERERAAIIARNRARMAALQLPALAAELAELAPKRQRAKAAASQKGVARKRGAAALALPPRVSLRSRGVAPDGGEIVHEGRDGRVVVAGAGDGSGAAAAAPAGPPPKGSHIAGADMPLESFNASAASDAAFLDVLRRQAGGPEPTSAAAGSTGAALMRYRLAEADVAKVTKGATTCMGWHPCSGAYPLIAAGDKYGQVGLWAVDFDAARDGFDPSAAAAAAAAAVSAAEMETDAAEGAEEEENLKQAEGGGGSGGSRALKKGGGGSGDGDKDGDDDDGDGGFDGIATFHAHASYVAAMRWVGAGRGAKLLSAAWDGSARLLDPEAGKLALLPGLPPPDAGAEFSAAEAEQMGGGVVAYLATPEGGLRVVDDRRGGAPVAEGLHLHDRKVNTLALGPEAGPCRLLASACTDGTVKVWDARRLAAGAGGGKKPAPLSVVCHQKSSQGAAWAPDGSARLLSVSFDDTLKVWGPPTAEGAAAAAPPLGTKFAQRLSVKHDNNTGRWVLPFRPAWWGPGALLVGDMKRGVAVFDAASGARVGLLQAEAMTAIPSRLAPWGAAPGGGERGPAMLAAATNSGRVHVFRA